MNLIRRPAPILPACCLVLSLCAAPAALAAIDETVPDATTLAHLEARAQQAPPRDQCFLYTELVHALTELAGRQILAGDDQAASDTLRKIEHYAQLIHLGLSEDPKRLKNAEQLMEHTAFRLHEYSRYASSDDRAVLNTTLTRLDHLEDELLTQIFKH